MLCKYFFNSVWKATSNYIDLISQPLKLKQRKHTHVKCIVGALQSSEFHSLLDIIVKPLPSDDSCLAECQTQSKVISQVVLDYQ